MSSEDDRIQIFADKIENILVQQLEEANGLIDSIDGFTSEEELIEILIKANSLLRFICAEDEDNYEKWRYKLIKTFDKKYIVFQGEEIKVEIDPEAGPSEE